MEQKVKSPIEAFRDNESGMWGFKNNDGKVVVPPTWWLVYHKFDEGMCAVTNDDKKIGFIDETGQLVIPCQYIWHSIFSEGLVKVQDAETHKMGYINKLGDVVIPFAFQKGGDFKDGIADVKDDNGKWGVINRKGETIIPFLYSNFINAWEHKALLFIENGRQVFKNRHGEIITPDLWKTMNTFHEGLVTVVDESDHYGFANEEGQMVFAPQWDYACYFENGYAYVRKGEERFYMDHDGNMLLIHYNGPAKISSSNGLDYIQRMYFKTVYPVSAALLDDENAHMPY